LTATRRVHVRGAGEALFGGAVRRRSRRLPTSRVRPGRGADDVSPWRYTGEQYDPTAGLYRLGVRYYDPTLGRFTQIDPLKHLLDLRQGNRYSYAADDPANNADPTGETSFFQGLATAVGRAFAIAGLAVGGPTTPFGVGFEIAAGVATGVASYAGGGSVAQAVAAGGVTTAGGLLGLQYGFFLGLLGSAAGGLIGSAQN